MTGPDPIDVALLVISQLEAQRIPYLIGGSLVTMVYGEARLTHDVDIVADMLPEQVDAFVAGLGEEFYADRVAILEAVERHDQFNVIHLKSVYKVDVFIPPRAGHHEAKWARRRRQALRESGEEVWLTSPEDIVLQKLAWYRSGDEVSDQQWRDVLGVLKVQGSRLDLDYVRLWAGRLGVDDLLERALDESFGEP